MATIRSRRWRDKWRETVPRGFRRWRIDLGERRVAIVNRWARRAKLLRGGAKREVEFVAPRVRLTIIFDVGGVWAS